MVGYNTIDLFTKVFHQCLQLMGRTLRIYPFIVVFTFKDCFSWAVSGVELQEYPSGQSTSDGGQRTETGCRQTGSHIISSGSK